MQNLLLGPKSQKTSISEKQNTSVSGLGIFREKPLTEGLPEETVKRISSARRNSTLGHCELAWRRQT